MEMLLRGFIMPRPIPVPIRQAMFRLWQKGYGTRQIAESLGLPRSPFAVSSSGFVSTAPTASHLITGTRRFPRSRPPSWWRPP